MQTRSRRHRNVAIPTLSAVGLAILIGPPLQAAVLECDTNICQGDPCTITGIHRMVNECILDFGTKDVTVGQGAKLIFPDDGSGTLKAHDLTLQGSVQGKGLGITIKLTGNLRTEGRGRVWAGHTRGSVDEGGLGPSWDIDVDGDIILAGASIKLSGDWAYLFMGADGNIQIDAPIKAAGCFDDFADVEIGAGGSITTTKVVSAKACGPGAGSAIGLVATGDVNVGAPLKLSRRLDSGFPLNVLVEAGGNATLDSVKLSSQLLGGEVKVQAAGDITLLGNVTARGWKDSAVFGDGGGGKVSLDPGPSGVVRVQKRTINTSCGPGCDTAGSITIMPGCYTDVTGSRFAARTDGPISLGCSCIHPTGSNVCDGGCVGLDTATFDPAISTSLPPCS